MTQKLPFREPIRRSPRKSNTRRLLFHFVLFTALAAVLLAMGIFGRGQLHQVFDAQLLSTRSTLLVSQGADAVKAVAESPASSNSEKRPISNGLASKTKAAKAEASRMLQEGAADEEVLAYLYETLSQAAVSKLKDEDEAQAALKVQVAENLADQREAVVADVLSAVEEKIGGTSVDDMRKSLSRDTAHYVPMYYSLLMLAVGGVLLVLGVGLGAVVFFGNEELRKKVTDIVEPLDYLLPFLFGVVVFTLYPMIRVFIMAFQERYQLTGEYLGWGLGNFRDVLFGVNTKLPQALSNTFLYVILTVPISTALALVLAYLLNQKIRFRALFQTAYFLPMVTSATAVGLVWKFMFHDSYGVINWLLSLFGGAKVAWLTNPAFSMAVMVIYGVWDALPFTIILLISGLQNIDDHYYTVAKVDGARAKRIFFRITVPLLSPTIGLVLIINSISAFKVFNSVVVLFSGYPGPMYNMYTMTYYIYEQIKTNMEYGRAAAASLILFLFIFLFTMLQRFIQRKWKYD